MTFVNSFSILRPSKVYERCHDLLVLFSSSTTDLYLHPASEIVSQEVGSHRVQHINLVWLECHSFLIEVVPATKIH